MNEIKRRLTAEKIVSDYFKKKLVHLTKHKIVSHQIGKCDLYYLYGGVGNCNKCTGYWVDDGNGRKGGTCVHPEYFRERKRRRKDE